MTSGYQLLIVFALVLVLFGGAKLPQLARSIGEAQREFQSGLRGGDENAKGESKDTESTESAGNTESAASEADAPDAKKD